MKYETIQYTATYFLFFIEASDNLAYCTIFKYATGALRWNSNSRPIRLSKPLITYVITWYASPNRINPVCHYIQLQTIYGSVNFKGLELITTYPSHGSIGNLSSIRIPHSKLLIDCTISDWLTAGVVTMATCNLTTYPFRNPFYSDPLSPLTHYKI